MGAVWTHQATINYTLCFSRVPLISPLSVSFLLTITPPTHTHTHTHTHTDTHTHTHTHTNPPEKSLDCFGREIKKSCERKSSRSCRQIALPSYWSWKYILYKVHSNTIVKTQGQMMFHWYGFYGSLFFVRISVIVNVILCIKKQQQIKGIYEMSICLKRKNSCITFVIDLFWSHCQYFTYLNKC